MRLNVVQATLLSVVLVGCTNASSDKTADMIISGGTILTMVGDSPEYVEAVAVDDGMIVYAGDLAGAQAYRGSETADKNLKGRTMLPGFVDPHSHIMIGGLQALSANLLSPPDGEVTDIPSLVQTLKDWAKANAEAVASANVIVGFGYDNAQLAELRHPTKEELDQVSNDIPVMIVHQSGHLASANSAALALVGYDSFTENPAGGVIQRKPGTNEPNGTLEEAAFFPLAAKVVAQIGPVGLEEFARAGSENWMRFGYTTAQEARSVPDTVNVMRKVAEEGGFMIDVATYPDVLVDREFIKTNYSPDYTNHFRVAGAKLTIDGSPQGFTAHRHIPYYDPVGNYPEGYAGYATASEEQVMDAVEWSFANDIQIITHANGEAASDTLIKALTAARETNGDNGRRSTLIHGQFLREDQLDSFNELGVIPSLFPMHTFYWGDWHCEHTVGPELCPNISPTGWVRERGMIFTTHHDAPVALPNSMRVLDATVTRRSRTGKLIGPDQRVSPYVALQAMTIWPAYQIFEEATKGTIEVGKLADFVVLSGDPLEVDPENLDQLQVVETIKEGAVVYALGS